MKRLVLVLATFTICTAQPQPPNPAGWRGFDPQPEPPRWQAGYVNPGVLRGFNPQPDPPGVIRPGTLQGLNPQPLPPRLIVSPGTLQGLNPQPLPPRTTGWSQTSAPPGYYLKR